MIFTPFALAEGDFPEERVLKHSLFTVEIWRKANMNKKSTESRFSISPEIERVVHDGQRLLCYIARNGDTELSPELTKCIVDAKFKVAEKKWSVEDESDFLLHYDKLAKIVYPVTVDSINAIVPKRIQTNNKAIKTKAEKAVIWYRRYTMTTLVFLIVTQLYWLFGNDLHSNLQDIFESREQLKQQFELVGKDKNYQAKIESQLKIENQQLDANYNLLLLWNKVWSLGGTIDARLPQYFQTEYELKKKELEKNVVENEIALDQLKLGRSLHEVRIVFFENILSANLMLTAFQSYLLPFMYGLLGAFIYVLRDLLREIKSMTYAFDSEIRYRLRLPLGALAGMVVGWFLKTEDANAIASLSPMALAFLMGYNVDVFFSLMDKAIANIKQAIEKPASNKKPES